MALVAASHTLKGKIFLILEGQSSQITRGVILEEKRVVPCFVLSQGCDLGHYPVE